MESLQPVFASSVSPSVFFGEQDKRTDSAAETGEVAALTLEFNSDPFKAFIKDVEYLIETNPQEAFRLLSLTLQNNTFSAKAQTEKLIAKIDNVIERLAEKPMTFLPKPHGPSSPSF